jgi:hypothetical protein
MLSFYNYCLTKFPPDTFTFDKPNKTPYIELYSLAGARRFYKQLGFTPMKPKKPGIINRLRRWSKSNVETGEMKLKIPYASMKSKLDENNTLIVDINDDIDYIEESDDDIEESDDDEEFENMKDDKFAFLPKGSFKLGRRFNN